MTNVTERHEASTATSIDYRWLFVGVGVLGLLVVVVAWGYVTIRPHPTSDPRFCATCHETGDQYLMWTESHHNDIACQECHETSEADALLMLRRFAFGGSDTGSGEPLHNPRPREAACAGCHRHNDSDWPEIDGSDGHEVHLAADDVGCLDCHARSIHAFGAALESCAECHGEHFVEPVEMEQLHCLACHDFLGGDDSLLPARDVCLDCHRSEGVDLPVIPENAPMGHMTCDSCHRPHEGTRPQESTCTGCHDDVETYGLHSLSFHDTCADCHPAHEFEPRPTYCLDCHDAEEHAGDETCWDCHDMSSPGGAR